MSRYRDRRLQMPDLVRRFESQSSAEHYHDAIAAIQRLRGDRQDYCKKGSPQDTRWEEACNTLLTLLGGMRGRREFENQDLATAMREFLQEFEHSTLRIDQILHSDYARRKEAPNPEIIYDWLDVAFRMSTYAILSTWIDDKVDTRNVRISIDIVTGETQEEWTYIPMTVPKKYRRATKKQ